VGIAALRTSTGAPVARTFVSAAAVRPAGVPTRGAKWASGIWFSDYWCTACIVAPAPRPNITYDCTPKTTPVPSGENCTFTCDNADEVPVEGTAPICVTSGGKKTVTVWAVGPNGPAACEPVVAPGGCTTPPTDADGVVFDCAEGQENDVCPFTCVAPGVPLTDSEGPTCDGTDWIDALIPAACVECVDNSTCTSPATCQADNTCA